MNSETRGRRQDGSGQDVFIGASRTKDLMVAQGLPPYALATALGLGARADCTTAVAAVTSIPTTTAMFTLWNGASSKSYIIDQMLASQWEGNNTTPAAMTILSCLHPVGMAQPDTQDITPIKLNGNGNYGGNAWCDVGATVVNNGWTAWGGMVLGVHQDDAVPGATLVAPVEGRIVLPPRAGLSMAVVSDRTSTKVKCGFLWYEVDMDLG